ILGGQNLTHRDFALAVCKAAGVALPRWEVPTAPFAAAGKAMEWVADHITRRPPLMVDRSLRYMTERFLYFDIRNATAELGYQPGPFEDTVAEAVAWFQTGREQRLSGS